MSELSSYATVLLATAGGAGLGVVFYAGLWWTVTYGVRARRPALIFLCSLLARTALVAVGLLSIAQGSWQRAAGAAVGLIAARVVVTRVARGAGWREEGTV